jgi:hypothetical protein
MNRHNKPNQCSWEKCIEQMGKRTDKYSMRELQGDENG